ncbi:hypothetical protein DERF_011856 [Dermatophagoides farinae]|uniref:Uncharacterized protein n=1 Tax=Dermatophagoides farinae TaxID=6954 RepID=A0A922L0X5_DERFA|nr:hypothetical protein DERF_011856 [Dermatophagoides farinae]
MNERPSPITARTMLCPNENGWSVFAKLGDSKVKDKRHLHVGLQKLLSELFQDLPFSKPNTLRRSCNGSYDKLVMLRPDHSSMPGRVRQDGKKIQISEIN